MILSGRAMLAGVIGWPIAHSRSPRLHGYWLERYKIDGAYVPLAVPTPQVAQTLRVLAAIGFRGVNVTVPHKEAALAAVDVVDPRARLIGAVNTVTMESDGTLKGSNTDADGFLAHLRASAPSWNPRTCTAVVIGAGGAARAVVAALSEAGVPEIRLANRTRERAEELAMAFGKDTSGKNTSGKNEGSSVRVVPWLGRHGALEGAQLVVNTTTLGMSGQPELDLNLGALELGSVVFDCVYAPLETPLLASARARGLIGVDGLGMLIHQARPGFSAWFGVEPEVDEGLRRFLAEGL